MEKGKKEPPEKKATDKMFDKAANTLNWWNRMATIQKNDPLYVGFFKIILRIFGILFLLAISPFVILGLIVGVTAAL